MAALTSSANDNEVNLLYKIASNFYAYAVLVGKSGAQQPSLNDNSYDLWRKICNSSAAIAS